MYSGKLDFFLCVYGEDYLPFLRVCLGSLVEHLETNDTITVTYEKVSAFEMEIMRHGFPAVIFRCADTGIEITDAASSRISKKLMHWRAFLDCRGGNGLAVMLDVDTVLVRSLRAFIPEEPFDLCLTWKPEPFVLNTGVVLARRTESARTFVNAWADETLSCLGNEAEVAPALAQFGGLDQYAVARLLSTNDYTRPLAVDIKGCVAAIAMAPCSKINQTNSMPPDSGAALFHLKGAWHPILLADGEYTRHRTENNSAALKEYWINRDVLALESSWKTFVMRVCRSQSSHFEAAEIDYVDRGMLNSELHAVIALLKELHIDVLIESGRYLGKSTRELCRGMRDTGCVIHSTELVRDGIAEEAERRLHDCVNLTLHYGDAAEVIPSILEQVRGKRVAILLDGPKGPEAFAIFSDAIAKHANVLVGFIHDLRATAPGAPNVNRTLVHSWFERVFFTDDNDFVRSFERLDAPCAIPGKWTPFHKGWQRIGSYGPTLGIVAPTWRDRLRAARRLAAAEQNAERQKQACAQPPRHPSFRYRLHDYAAFRLLKRARRLPALLLHPSSRPERQRPHAAARSEVSLPVHKPTAANEGYGAVFCGYPLQPNVLHDSLASGEMVYLFEADMDIFDAALRACAGHLNAVCFPFDVSQASLSPKGTTVDLAAFLLSAAQPVRKLVVRGRDRAERIFRALDQPSCGHMIEERIIHDE